MEYNSANMKHLAIIAMLTLAACGAKVQPGEVGDTVTTAVGLASGAAELNPILSGAGDAAPIVSLVAKQAVKAALIESGYEAETVNSISDSLSWGATCNNLVVIGGGAGGLSLAAGLICVWLTWEPIT